MVVRVVQDPDLLVARVIVVVIGPVGASLAETVTVRDEEHARRLQLWIVIGVGASVTDRSAPNTAVPSDAQPNSSEMSANRPVLEIEYV